MDVFIVWSAISIGGSSTVEDFPNVTEAEKRLSELYELYSEDDLNVSLVVQGTVMGIEPVETITRIKLKKVLS